MTVKTDIEIPKYPSRNVSQVGIGYNPNPTHNCATRNVVSEDRTWLVYDDITSVTTSAINSPGVRKHPPIPLVISPSVDARTLVLQRASIERQIKHE